MWIMVLQKISQKKDAVSGGSIMDGDLTAWFSIELKLVAKVLKIKY